MLEIGPNAMNDQEQVDFLLLFGCNLIQTQLRLILAVVVITIVLPAVVLQPLGRFLELEALMRLH